MRISPSNEQIAYLASIGVSSAKVSPPLNRNTGEPARGPRAATVKKAINGIFWWLVLVPAAVLAILALTQMSTADETVPSKLSDLHEEERATGPRAEECHESREQTEESEQDLKKPNSGLVEAQGTECLQRDSEGVRSSLARDTGTHQRWADDPEARPPSATVVTDEKLRSLYARVEMLEAALAFSSEQFHMTLESLQRHSAQGLEETVRRVSHFSRRHSADTMALTIGGSSCALLLLLLTIILRATVMRRLRQVESFALSYSSEWGPARAGPAAARKQLQEAVGGVVESDTRIRAAAKPERPIAQGIPPPPDQMKEIIRSAEEFCHIRVIPLVPEGRWTLGLATIKGNVRSENQDYGLCFSIDDHDVVVVADGCGGVPHGQRAAYLAVLSATASVTRTFGMASKRSMPDAQGTAAKALLDASHRLAIEGDKMNVSHCRGGLRTTLIVVIAGGQGIGYAYIGDGGACVVRASGDVEYFLTPQKADPSALNVLAASLGPTMEGEPQGGLIQRSPGDVVIVGTDGVFDRVDQAFPKEVLRGCIALQGDLQAVAEQVVDELAAFQDDAGYVCDDNLTLALMGNGSAPRLPHGFWNSDPSVSVNKVASGDQYEAESPAGHTGSVRGGVS